MASCDKMTYFRNIQYILQQGAVAPRARSLILSNACIHILVMQDMMITAKSKWPLCSSSEKMNT